MTLKLNKACDLSSISVLPPQSRRSNVVPSGAEPSSIYGRSQSTSQIRPQQSQITLSQGASSQHGFFSQFSQNSQDEILTNDVKLGSQERENSVRRPSFLPPPSYTREESQMMVSRASNSLVRKRSGQEYKSQINEDLEHRIGVIETSLSRLGMILDSVQSDIIQVNKGTQEVSLEMQSVRKKLFAQDDTLQTMSKVQEDIKTCLKSVSDQLKQITNQENSGEIISSLSSALSEKIDTHMVKLQNDLHMDFCKEIQAISCSMKISEQNQAIRSTDGSKAAGLHDSSPLEVKFSNKPSNVSEQNQAIRSTDGSKAAGLHDSSPLEVKFANKPSNVSEQNQAIRSTDGSKAAGLHDSSPLEVKFAKKPKASINSARMNLKEQKKSQQLKVEMGGWRSVKPERAPSGVGNLRRNQIKASPNPMEGRIVIDSDGETDEGFSCLLSGTVIDDYSAEQAMEETARILRKARRRKRKHSSTIIIN